VFLLVSLSALGHATFGTVAGAAHRVLEHDQIAGWGLILNWGETP
jgi:hypothetical protein